MPVILKLRTGDLVLKIKTDVIEGPSKIDEQFFLEVRDAGAGEAGVITLIDQERLQTARVAPADLARLKATQAKAIAVRANDKGRGQNGSFVIAIIGGCRTGELANLPLKASLFMKTKTGADWFSVLSNLDLRKTLGDEALSKIPTCT